MNRRPPRSTRTDTLFPYTTLFRSGRERHYFDLHAVLDVKHSEAWNREAIGPLVAEDERRARAIAEGALIRLRCGARCFERYRSILWQTNEADQKADTSARSEEHTSELQSLMSISYAVFCLKKKKSTIHNIKRLPQNN